MNKEEVIKAVSEKTGVAPDAIEKVIKAFEEQAKVRAIYEELVLKKPQPTVVQIGTLNDINKAVPANFANANKPVSIDPAPKQEAEPVAGD